MLDRLDRHIFGNKGIVPIREPIGNSAHRCGELRASGHHGLEHGAGTALPARGEHNQLGFSVCREQVTTNRVRMDVDEFAESEFIHQSSKGFRILAATGEMKVEEMLAVHSGHSP